MNKFFYILFIKLYLVVIKAVSPFNAKARLWRDGRKNLVQKIADALSNNHTKKIWMHCASLGEYEQGKPVIESLKKEYPHYNIVLTFFSPSGYEVKKNSNAADYIFYLPMDSEKNAAGFLNAVNPSLIIFIKYEYWYYYLKTAYEKQIPLLLVSGIFLPQQSFFKWYGNLLRKMLTFFTHLFVQTETSKQLLAKINIHQVTVSGDTRFDRVLEVADTNKNFPEIAHFINHKRTIVAGSTWTDDDEALDHFANTNPEMRFIIAPHSIDALRIKECCLLYKSSITYSKYKTAFLNNSTPENINTLIIDSIGDLKFLYRFATICYVGGGFGNAGIHNILEAAVYYKPVVIGPTYEKFYEAVSLVEKEGAFDVEDALELENKLNELLHNENLYAQACKTSGDYVKSNAGATEKIIHYIQEKRLLTNSSNN